MIIAITIIIPPRNICQGLDHRPMIANFDANERRAKIISNPPVIKTKLPTNTIPFSIKSSTMRS